MAQVQDGLWVARNAAKIERYCGPGQMGGVFDPISAIVALVLHTQLRASQGLSTYWSMADLRWAFDVADIPSMRFHLFKAGVFFNDWLVMDDIMGMDRQCIQLHGLLSVVFVLGCGTGQGRRYSVHVFNALLRWLPDEIEKATMGGTRTVLPSFAVSALRQAHAARPAQDSLSVPMASSQLAVHVAEILMVTRH